MSGILIDVDTRSASAKKDLASLNKELANLVSKSNETSKGLIRSNNGTDLKNLNKEILKTNNAFNGLKSSSTTALGATSNSIRVLTSNIFSLKTVLIAAATAFTVFKATSFFNNTADELTRLSNRLKLVTKDTEDLNIVFTKLIKIARESRTDLQDTTNLFVDFSQALKKSNISQAEILKVVNVFQKGAALSGASAESLRAAVIQLGQGFSAGALRGEELNSFMEQHKYLSIKLQQQLKMNAGAIRKFAEEGKLAPELLITAFAKMSDEVERDFAKTNTTASEGFSQLAQSIKLSIGSLNKELSFSNKSAKSLLSWSDSILDGTQNLIIGSRIALQAAKNYFKLFEVLDNKAYALNSIFSFEINPLEYFNAKGIHSQLNDTLTKLKDKLKKDIEPVEFSFKSLFKFERVKTAFDFKYYSENLARLALNLVNTFNVTASNLKRVIYRFTAPVTTVSRAIHLMFIDLSADFNAFSYKALTPITRSLEAFNEMFNLFATKGTQIQRAWVDIFKAKSLKEFNFALEKLNLASATRNLLFFQREAIDISLAINKANRAFYDLLRTFGLMKNTSFGFSINTSELMYTLNTFKDAMVRVYQDVFGPVIEPYIKKGLARINLFLVDAFKAISVAFNEKSGLKFGENLIAFIKQTLSFVFNAVKELDFTLTLENIELFFSGDLSKNIIEAIKNVLLFFKGFLKALYIEAVSGLSKVSEVVKDFAEEVKEYFFDIYDKVVGNSYWPDMIDGVIEYTSKLFKSNEIISDFVSDINELFSKLSKYVLDNIKNIQPVLQELFNDIKGIDFGKIFTALAKNLSATLLSVFLFVFGNAQLKLLATSYFISTFNLALEGAFSKVGGHLLEISGGAFGIIAERTVEGFFKTINSIITALPHFVKNFLAELGPIGFVFSKLFDVSPINKLLTAMLAGLTVYLVTAKNGFNKIKEMILGKDTKKGRIEGIVDYIKPFLNQTTTRSTGPSLFSKIFGDKKAAIAAAAIFSTAFLDSISFFEAAIFGIPILAIAFLGKDGGARLIKDTFKIGLKISEVFFTVLLASIRVKTKSTFLTNLIDNLLGNTSSIQSVLSRRFGLVLKEINSIINNVVANRAAYASGNISLSEMFTKNFATGKNTNLSRAISLFVGTAFKDINQNKYVQDFKIKFITLFDSIFNSANLAQIKNFSSGVTLFISGAFKSILKFGKDAASKLAEIYANLSFFKTGLGKFLLLAGLAFGLSSTAQAASDASTALSEFGSVIFTLIAPILALTTMLTFLNIAKKALLAYKANSTGVKGFLGFDIGGLDAFKTSLSDSFQWINKLFDSIKRLSTSTIFNIAWWRSIKLAIINFFNGDILSNISSLIQSGARLSFVGVRSLLRGLLTVIKDFGKVILGGIAGAAFGIFTLALFGPAGPTGIVDNIEWMVDKAKGFLQSLSKTILGMDLELKQTGQAARYSTIYSELPIRDFQDSVGKKLTFDLTASLNKIDFKALTSTQMELLTQLSTTTKDAIKNLDTLFFKQGYLTEEQIKELNKLQKEFESVSQRLPAKEKLTDNEFADRNVANIGQDPGGIWNFFKKKLGIKPLPFRDLGEDPKLAEGFLNITTRFFSNLYDFIVTSLKVLWITVKTALLVIVVTSIVAAISAPFLAAAAAITSIIAGAWFLFGDELKDMFNSFKDLTIVKKTLSAVEKFFTELQEEAARRFGKNTAPTFTDDEKRRQRRLKVFSDELLKNPKLITDEQRSTLASAASRRDDALEQMRKYYNSYSTDFDSNKDKRDKYFEFKKKFEEYDDQLFDLNRIFSTGNSDQALTTKIADDLKIFSESAKTLLDVDLGEIGEKFFGTPLDLIRSKKILDNYKSIQELSKSSGSKYFAGSVLGKLNLEIEKRRLKKELEQLVEDTEAKLSITVYIDKQVAKSESLIFKEYLQGLLLTDPIEFLNVNNLIDNLQKAKNELDAFSQLEIQLNPKKYRQLLSKVNDLKVAIAENLKLDITDLFSLNTDLKALGLSELDARLFLEMDKSSLEAIQFAATELRQATQEYAKASSERTSDTKAKLREQLKAKAVGEITQKEAIAKTAKGLFSKGEVTQAIDLFSQIGITLPDNIDRSYESLKRFYNTQLDIFHLSLDIERLKAGLVDIDPSIVLSKFASSKDRAASVQKSLEEFSFNQLRDSTKDALGIELSTESLRKFKGNTKLEELLKQRSSLLYRNEATSDFKNQLDPTRDLTKLNNEILTLLSIDSEHSPLYYGFENIQAALERVGAESDEIIKLLDKSTLKELLRFDTKLIGLKLKLNVATSNNEIISIKKEIQNTTAELENFKTSLTSFSDLDKINSIFESSFNVESIAIFGNNFLSELSAGATLIEKEIENILKTGVTLSKQSITQFLRDVEDLKDDVKIKSVFQSLTTNLRTAVTSGFKQGLELFNNSLSLNFTESDYRSLDPKLHSKLGQEQIYRDTYQKLLDINGLTERQLAILSQYGSEKPLSEILNEFFATVSINNANTIKPLEGEINDLSSVLRSTVTPALDALTDALYSTKSFSTQNSSENSFPYFNFLFGEPLEKAGGGHISGSGGPTDDKIPAMLSNGEFVVNAKATKRNRGLLERINSGIPHFSEGGLLLDSDLLINDDIAQLIDNYTLKFNNAGFKKGLNLNALSGDALWQFDSLLQNYTRELDKLLGLTDRLEDYDLLLAEYDITNRRVIAPSLLNTRNTNAGFSTIMHEYGHAVDFNIQPYDTLEDIKTRVDMARGSYEDIIKNESIANRYAEVLSPVGINKEMKAFRDISLDTYKIKSPKVLDKIKGATQAIPLLWNSIKESTGFSELRRKDLLEYIKEIPELLKSPSFYSSVLTGYMAESVVSKLPIAKGYTSIADALEGTASIPVRASIHAFGESAQTLSEIVAGTYTGEKFFKLQQYLKRLTSDSFGVVLRKSAGFASGGSVFGPGGPTDDKIPAMLSNGEFVVNAKATKKNRGLLESINNNSLIGFSEGSPSEGSIISTNTLDLKAFTEALNNFTKTAGKTRSKTYDTLTKNATAVDVDKIYSERLQVFKSLPINSQASLYKSFSKDALSINTAVLNNDQLKIIVDYVEKLLELERNLQKAKLNGEGVREAALAFEQASYEFNEILERASKTLTQKMRETGKAFSEGIINDFQEGFVAVLQYDRDLDEFIETFGERITNQIISSFINGLIEGATGDGSFIGTYLKKMGENLFAAGAKIFGEDPKNPAKPKEAIFSSAVDAFGKWVRQLLGGNTVDTIKDKTNIPGFGNDGLRFGSDQYNLLEQQEFGLSEEDKEGWKGSAIDPPDLTESIAKPLKEVGNSFTKIFTDLGKTFKDLFSGSNSIFSNLSQMFTGGSTSSSSGGSVFSSIGSIFGGSSNISTGSDQNWLGSIASIFGFADGGMIQGPGTGTSDSIVAALSNGEYVINARAAKDNLALLNAINFGKLPKFAEGGLVGNAKLDQPSMNNTKESLSTKPGETKVFNINITGDISRQTRAEVQKMIPQLANGISSYHRERGQRA